MTGRIKRDHGCPAPGTGNALRGWAGTAGSLQLRAEPGQPRESWRLAQCAPEPGGSRAGRAPRPSPGSHRCLRPGAPGPKLSTREGATARAALRDPTRATHVPRSPRSAHPRRPARGFAARLPGDAQAQARPAQSLALPLRPRSRPGARPARLRPRLTGPVPGKV